MSINGVSTSVTAFIGMSARGPQQAPTRILGIAEYESLFGSDDAQGEMVWQVRQFFINGGETAWVVRVADGARESTLPLQNAAGDTVLELTSRDAGSDANRLRAKVLDPTAGGAGDFDLELYREANDAGGQAVPVESERHTDLCMDPTAPRYVSTVLEQQSRLATARATVTDVHCHAAVRPASSGPDSPHGNGSGNGGPLAFTHGSDGSLARVADYEQAFRAIDERVDLFNVMVLPKSAGDTGTPSERARVWGVASSFCQRRRAFLIVDIEPPRQTPQSVLQTLQSLRRGVVGDHAALWWPQLTVTDNGADKNIDPSGSIAGIMARIDGTRGVWRAPAGLEAAIYGVQGVAVPVSHEENGLLNPQAANAIRSLPAGIVSWGARTMYGFDGSGNIDYRYVPVRRLALHIEESLVRGLEFSLSEPNDDRLWSRMKLAAEAFMNGLFRQGAFAGESADDAYFVKADAETTTPADRDRGIVNVLVGFAPVGPAEFVVISLRYEAGQSPGRR